MGGIILLEDGPQGAWLPKCGKNEFGDDSSLRCLLVRPSMLFLGQFPSLAALVFTRQGRSLYQLGCETWKLRVR
jgi:hypothetical protein